MKLAETLMYVGIIGMVFFTILSWPLATKLFKDILLREPEFLKDNPNFDCNFGSRPAALPWIILRGKYKSLKNAQLKKRCHIQRVFLILTNLFFAVAFFATLYMSLMHYVH